MRLLFESTESNLRGLRWTYLMTDTIKHVSQASVLFPLKDMSVSQIR